MTMDVGVVKKRLDHLVELGVLPDLKDEETVRRDHRAILMGLAVGLRPSVNRSAMAMEGALRDNDWKGGWDTAAPGYLLARAWRELRELEAAPA